jgi:hypothetical protein
MTKRFLLMLTVFALLLGGLTVTGCSNANMPAPPAPPADSPQSDAVDEEDGDEDGVG